MNTLPRPATDYVGRFAPSPTGPLHFGSLVAALGSYVAARQAGGRWLVRIEDLDPPREVAGARDDILATLDRLGLHWDSEVVLQSARSELYAAALEALAGSGSLYACSCSRRELAGSPVSSTGETIYPGTCARNGPRPRRAHAWRVRSVGAIASFEDRIQGPRTQRLQQEVGDFVVLRKDGLYAYHLAVVVDDHQQGVTDVVRGYDLIDSTPRQIHLQGLLGYATPRYAHLPVAVDEKGSKLSKQTRAAPLSAVHGAGRVLAAALEFLRQAPPPDLARAEPAEVLEWAVENWRPSALNGVSAAPAPRL